MNKIFHALYLLPLSFLMTGCWTASILTVHEPVVVREKPVPQTYVTTVTTPSPKVTTVTTFVATNYNTDLSFYLDLNAVAAAFAESRSTREFEQILNSGRYMINNLDLNRDGWIDYLRVIETRQGFYHAYLIQSCVGAGLFQDVATLVAERQANALYVEVIGDPYLYGYNYIVRPVFVKTPPIWDVYGRANYTVWSSPYYYGYYPSYYTKPQPVYLNHYQAYVTTYLTNHHYCHRCDYPSKPHYSGYTQMTQSHRRSDYQTQHPDDSFERRVSRAATEAGKSVRNTAQLRTEVEKSSTRTSTNTQTSTGTATRTSTNTGSRTSQSATTKPATTNTQSTPATRTTRTPGTTIDTRVTKSGTTRTTVKTTDSTGRTTTIKRESGSATRSSNSGSRTSGANTRSTNTRSTGTVRSVQGTTTESSPRSSQRGR